MPAASHSQLSDALRDAKLKLLKELRPKGAAKPEADDATTTTAAAAAAGEATDASGAAALVAGGQGPTTATDESEVLAQQLISELRSADPQYLPLLLECLRR
jgi:hypothetical protein